MNTPEKDQKIIKLYQEGNSLKKVAILMGMSFNSNTQIKRVLVRNNIKRRPCVNSIIEMSTCPKCGKPIELKYMLGHKKKKFCSRSCANSHEHPEETRLKIKAGVKAFIKIHGQTGGNKDFLNNPIFTSKGEREVRKYFKENFPNDEWTWGGGIKIEDSRISRDLYSNKLKVCIEYDGIWHFKDIHGQLAKKQFKDRLLELWCKENSYRLIRIREEIYKKDKDLWLRRLVNAAYCKEQGLIKFY